ncbi:MAG: hypothetical protein CMH57_06865 [Myxococcales bacterium]|nr:hypothetical protein [Myxococcales bacterium]
MGIERTNREGDAPLPRPAPRIDMTTALFNEENRRPALTLVNAPSATPLEAIGALGELEGFVLSAICLRLERGLARLDMATARGLMDERGLRPAQLVLLGDRPLESLNGLGPPTPEHAAINAVLTTAIVRYAANLPEAARGVWQSWMVGQLERLQERTPFQLTEALPEGLSLHPDAELLESIHGVLREALRDEEPGPRSALEVLRAALPPMPEAPRPASTHGLAAIPTPPRNQVVSVARPVLPPPSHRVAIRREATVAIFESVLGPLRLRRRVAPSPAAPVAAGPLPRPALDPVVLTPPADALDLPDDLTAVPNEPAPLPSLDPEPAPLPRLGIETDLLKSIDEGDVAQTASPEAGQVEWVEPLFDPEPAISFGHVELPEELDFSDVQETLEALRRSSRAPADAPQTPDDPPCDEAARDEAGPSDPALAHAAPEPRDEEAHGDVAQALAEPEQPAPTAPEAPIAPEGEGALAPQPMEVEPALGDAFADAPAPTPDELERVAAIAPCDALAATADPLPALIEPVRDAVFEPAPATQEEAEPGMALGGVEAALDAEEPSLGSLRLAAEQRLEPSVDRAEVAEEASAVAPAVQRRRAQAPRVLLRNPARRIPRAAQERVSELVAGHLEPASPDATRAIALHVVEVALQEAPSHFKLGQRVELGASVERAAFPFRIDLPSDEEGLVADPMYIERMLGPVDERSFFDRDDAPLLPPESLGALSGMVGVGFGLWVVLEALLIGNALWMGLGLVLMVSLLALDYVLSTDG